MAKIEQLTKLNAQGGRDEIFPVTSFDAVRDEYGNNLRNAVGKIMDIPHLEDIVLTDADFTLAYPARTTGKNSASSSFSGYKVDISGYYEQGYRRVYFRGAEYTETDTIRKGIILDSSGAVIAVTPQEAVKSNSWVYLELTPESKILWATYCRATGGGEVWEPTEVFVKDSGEKSEWEKMKDEIANLKGNSTHLRMLIIGNSYSADSFMYLPLILDGYGITCDITLAIRGNCTLKLHDEGFDNAVVDRYHIDTSKEKRWSLTSTDTLQDILTEKEFDIISLQQASLVAHSADSYEPYARNLIQKISSVATKPYSLAWNIGINRQSTGDIETIQSLILNNVRDVISTEPVNMIFPYGTAIFNARTNESLDALGDSGHLWQDGIHLQDGLPRYIAGLAQAQALFNVYYPQHSILGNKLRITDNDIRLWHMTTRGSIVGITEKNCLLGQMAAIFAVKEPFEITSSL